MTTYEILKLVFYILMCIPILVLGIYFIRHMNKEISGMRKSDAQRKQERINEEERRRNFDEQYRRRRG